MTLHVQMQLALASKKFAAKVARHLVVHFSAFLQLIRGRNIVRNLCSSTFGVLIGFGFFKGEQLLVSEALHHYLQFSPRVDARAQVLLEFYSGTPFVACGALFNSVCFPVGSESGNRLSVEKSLRGI
jgi:hypothetical protein